MFLDFRFFFFKQKTAYEMRISYWSSDVCSSDLRRVVGRTACFCRDSGASYEGRVQRRVSGRVWTGQGDRDMSDTEPKDHFILRHGLYFRPNAAGYTNEISQAGLYSERETKRFLSAQGVTVQSIRESGDQIDKDHAPMKPEADSTERS